MTGRGRNRKTNRTRVPPDTTGKAPSPKVRKDRPAFGGRLTVVLLSLLGVVLLSISFAPMNHWFVAYFALVPWILALDAGTTRRWALFWGWIAGIVFWAANLYWLWWITLVGYAGLVVYLSGYWFIAAVILRAGMRRKWPMWIVTPIVWVALEYARAYVISGFPWFFLAHSQYARTHLIQIADLTGQYGVSFFVAMVNGAVIDVLTSLLLADRRYPGRRRRTTVAVIVPTVVGIFLFGYGVLRVRESVRTTRRGPVIGIVQQAFPISLSGTGATAEKVFADHLAATQSFIGRNCDLVIWSETMLPKGLNPEMLDVDPTVLSPPDLRSLGYSLLGSDAETLSDEVLRVYLGYCINGGEFGEGIHVTGMHRQAEKIGELSRRLDCPILAGGSTVHRNIQPMNERDRWVTRNSILWFDRTWRASQIYSKRHLVPFSEYVPFRKSAPGLYRLLRRFVPPVMAQLDPGRSEKPFELIRDGRSWRLAGPICYEGTFARICRGMTLREGTKRIHILANLSNDGWFVYKRAGGSYRGSNEHSQHLVQYCFRAVENRVPVVRAVNTGISASIDSNGRMVGRLCLTLGKYKKYIMVPGALLLDGTREGDGEYKTGHGPQVLVDRRVSVYSFVGDVFALAVSAAAVLLVVRLPVWKRRKKEPEPESVSSKR